MQLTSIFVVKVLPAYEDHPDNVRLAGADRKKAKEA